MERNFGRLGGLFMDARKLLLVAAVGSGLLGSGCTPKKIPGTDINDTDDTRAILDVIEAYRHAYEKKDSATIVALLDESFRDDGGSANTEDDLEYRNAGKILASLFARVEDVRLDVSVRKIEFDQDNMKARAVYTWQSNFRLPSLTSRPQSEGEIKQMTFKRPDRKKKSAWRITSGI
jgi:hypothetical protein